MIEGAAAPRPLRVAIALGPAVSATFAVRDAVTGEPRGVTVDLGAELARGLGVPVSYVTYASSGAIAAAADSDEWDVTFVPVDAERRRVLEFGSAYSAFESTFLVRADASLERCSEVDRPGLRVGAIAHTTTARRAGAVLTRATLLCFDSVDVLGERMQAGELDAIALSRSALEGLAALLPGTRILEDAFHATDVAVAVPKGRGGALSALSAFVETAKSSGALQRFFVRAGLAAPGR